jgi:hypothetical protein
MPCEGSATKELITSVTSSAELPVVQEEANQNVSVTIVDTEENVRRSFKECQGVLRELLTPLSSDRVIPPLLPNPPPTSQSMPVVADVADTLLVADVAIIAASSSSEFHEDINVVE